MRWSVQEIRRVAMRLAQRRIRPAHVIAWSLWRRAHQAAARDAHIRRKPQLVWGYWVSSRNTMALSFLSSSQERQTDCDVRWADHEAEGSSP